VEANATVREPLGTPDLPPVPDGVDRGVVPDLDDLGVDAPPPDDRAVLAFEGGESAGLDRLETYVWERDCLREYKETRNGLLGADYSSKLSPWLNEGCLSPRRVEREVRRYEDRRVENESTYWLVFELRWRDFFQFQFAKHGRTFFAKGGIRRRDDVDWRTDEAAFDRWKRGETGVPFVDANMRELARTGYMSNRGRQNAASYLANDLRIDWRRGAAHFETELVDYDPCSNYGNWAYVAGVGNDSRDRSFDVVSQARTYDPEAAYVTTWVPELDPLPPEYAHEPWRLSAAEAADYGVELGVDYPEPVRRP
jgi:deoxyribodipyrimidine photo-lyase